MWWIGGSCIISPDWIKNKKATINLINGNKCFKYAAIVAVIHEEIGKKSQRKSKIKSFRNNYNWKGINYSSVKDGWKRFE